MILAKALTDELAEGFHGRLKLLNQCTSNKSLLDSLKSHFGLEGQDIPRVGLLAKAAGLDISEFCRGHTLIPYQRAVTHSQPDLMHGDPADITTLIYVAFKGLRLTAHFCPECAKNDLMSRGYSHWRRKDQIPGFDWCSIHGIPLMQCDRQFVTACMPSHTIGNKSDFVDQEENLLDNPVIQRYMLISEGFLSSRTPLHPSSASHLLSQRAQELGLRIGRGGNKGILSDLALQLAPTSWLERLLPDFRSKKAGHYFGPLDVVLLHGGSPHALALALALLFESADDALEQWAAYAPTLASPSDREGGLWQGQDVFRPYVKDGGIHQKITQRLNGNERTANAALESPGLPSLPRLARLSEDNAIKLFFSGKRLQEACQLSNADPEKVEALIRSAGAGFASALSQTLSEDVVT